MTKKASTIKSIGSALVLLGLACLCERTFTPVGVSEGYLAVSEAGQPSARAVAHALGEFRIVASNMIWLNVVDRYHHEYMEKGRDWQTDAAILPFLRIITWLDPHFIQAYDVAGAILCGINQYDEGQKFLTDGIKNNPTNWQLYYDVAMQDAWYRSDPKAALPFAKKAFDLADDPFYKSRVGKLVETLTSDIATNTPIVRESGS